MTPTHDPEFERRLGERLRAARDYLGMSQQYVADNIGILRSAVSAIEHGARRVDSLELKKLAKLYRQPVSWFLAEESDPDGERVLAGLLRVLAELTEGDQHEILTFAQYLRFRTARIEDQDAEPPDVSATTPLPPWRNADGSID
jgi:transcriptional regulator with XRE-family HTH domain